MSLGTSKARITLRLDPRDKDRIAAAANGCGVSLAEFVRGAALLRAEEVEGGLSPVRLPADVFEAFSFDIARPGRVILGLARAAAETEGRLKDES